MYMKTFIIMFKNVLKKDYPDIELAFYVSRRSKFVHMGLDVQLTEISNSREIINATEKYWLEKKTDDNFIFVEPYLIASNKRKYDYIEKIMKNDCFIFT